MNQRRDRGRGRHCSRQPRRKRNLSSLRNSTKKNSTKKQNPSPKTKYIISPSPRKREKIKPQQKKNIAHPISKNSNQTRIQPRRIRIINHKTKRNQPQAISTHYGKNEITRKNQNEHRKNKHKNQVRKTTYV